MKRKKNLVPNHCCKIGFTKESLCHFPMHFLTFHIGVKTSEAAAHQQKIPPPTFMTLFFKCIAL